ncbi:hypothetical protein D9Q98_007653 [Chlorella vulgaris]|uniref:Uncharacterized protein n=1 Tax=Chlorella vulgaris TaxID=3077 RepID=A0A9D4TLJ3_CHLVU|nr:hypothetical protein D9Q98_007653 [Chlorella vulgaris]
MAARGGGGGRGGPARVSNLDGDAPESTDFANYFCTYAYLYHQKDMLEDHKRTGAYYNACMQNREQFAGKVVLDVGTGSGILAIFAARAGARKVYAVEATDMAKSAKRLVAAQGLEGSIEVIQGVIESVELPEKVDIIISEWMGYFLLRESMLDSVLVARDRFLKPGGALYPSHARMVLAPIRSNQCRQRQGDFQNSMEGWAEFLGEMKRYYNVDLDCLSDDYRKEQLDYFSHTAAWTDIHPSQVVGTAAVFKTYDLHTLTLEELKAPLNASFNIRVLEDGPVDAYCGWFDTQFKGSAENPTTNEVVLSTAPDPTGATHWGQQSFFLHPPVDCAEGDVLAVEIDVVRRKDNQRLMDVKIQHRVEGKGKARTSCFHIE